MVKHSAGLLPFRQEPDRGPEVFLVRMGGPFWTGRDRAWSVAKGEYEPGREDAAAAAQREFAEEVGVEPPAGDLIDLGEFRLPSGKRLRVYAVHTTRPVEFVASNTFDVEWPRGSGLIRQFPEVDAGAWFDAPTAEQRIVAGQVPILAAWLGHVGGRGA